MTPSQCSFCEGNSSECGSRRQSRQSGPCLCLWCQDEAAGKQLEELQRELTAAQEARAEAEAQAQQLQQLTDRLRGSADEAAANTEAANAEIKAAKEAAARAEAHVAQLQSQAEEARNRADATSRELSDAQKQIQVACVSCLVLSRQNMTNTKRNSCPVAQHNENGTPGLPKHCADNTV